MTTVTASWGGRASVKGLLSYPKDDREPPVDGVDYAHCHLWGGVPVTRTHGAALVLPACSAER